MKQNTKLQYSRSVFLEIFARTLCWSTIAVFFFAVSLDISSKQEIKSGKKKGHILEILYPPISENTCMLVALSELFVTNIFLVSYFLVNYEFICKCL